MRPHGTVGWRGCAVLTVVFLCGLEVGSAQSNTRVLLSSGWGVPAHQGFAFGPFSNLAMNESREIVFLTTLRGSKSDLRALVRSSGVTFEVVAFQGLRAPVPKTMYESFSPPSINNKGQIAFTAALKDDIPISAVIRIASDGPLALATSGNAVPDKPDATFQELSPPVITSSGNVVFGARLGGKAPGSGLFLWTPHGLRTVALPAELALKPSDLLVPAFASHDEAVFVLRSAPREAVTEQLFRVVGSRSFQDLRPPPEESATVEVLPARAGEAPVRLLFVLAEGNQPQTALLTGDPLLAVKARKGGATTSVTLGRIQGQTAGPRGNVIFAAAPSEDPKDLALFCYCDGEVRRLTSQEEFLAVTVPAAGRPIMSLTGDGQHTMSFIAPAETGSDATTIFVVSVP